MKIKIAYTICISSFVFLISGCHYLEMKEVSTNVIGTYQFDLSESEIQLSKEDSLIFNSSLTITITKDSFRFSRKIPYFSATEGVWELEYIAPAVYINLIGIRGGKNQYYPGNGYMSTTYPYEIKEYPDKPGSLFFKKVKQSSSPN